MRRVHLRLALGGMPSVVNTYPIRPDVLGRVVELDSAAAHARLGVSAAIQRQRPMRGTTQPPSVAPVRRTANIRLSELYATLRPIDVLSILVVVYRDNLGVLTLARTRRPQPFQQADLDAICLTCDAVANLADAVGAIRNRSMDDSAMQHWAMCTVPREFVNSYGAR